MAGKVYIVFTHSAYDTFDGSWDGDTELDSVWEDQDSAKQRVADIANRFLEKLWYEDEAVPYKEVWNDNKTDVFYATDPYDQYRFYIEEHKIRSGFIDDADNKDLPALFTTT